MVDAADVQASINMSLGSSTCTANIVGSGVCNVVVVQRVINASLGQTCVLGSGRSVALTWVASTTPNVSYKIYRGAASGGPFTFLSSAGTTTNFNDTNVQSGITYYYVVTAVDSSGNESVYSNQAQAVIP
jgi:fibronectin type 3 domain-containing protein